MKKSTRDKVYNKFSGRCAFCGELLQPGWHVWDIIPIVTIVTSSGDLDKINTETGNLMPACKECGSVRIKNASGKMDIEEFRAEIISMYMFVRDGATYSSSLRRAIKFGIVTEINNPIIFYFERAGVK